MINKIKNKVNSFVYLSFAKSGFFTKNIEDTIIITGSPRSGTTWLAELLSEGTGGKILWEPFHLRHQKYLKTYHFSWRPIVRPDNPDPSIFKLMRDILTGRRVDSHTGKYLNINEAHNAPFWILKFVRANHVLDYLRKNFPVKPPILLLRHPCAVVSSQMHRRTLHQTVTREKTEQMWDQGLPDLAKEFCEHHPQYEDYLKKLKSWEEILAAMWSMDNYFLSYSDKKNPYVILSYEKLVKEGEPILKKLFTHEELTWNQSVMEKFNERSSTVVKGSNLSKGKNPIIGWKEKLNQDQIEQILKVVNFFGIHCYGTDPEPDYEYLNRLTEYPI